MCGIAGIINERPDWIESGLKKMSGAITHRGPDDSGFFIDKAAGVGLASRRLSIIDLSENGHMPMTNEDGTVVACQNGEIYNYQDLFKDLVAHGHKFKSVSDTEVIVHGYEEWGTALFGKLRGMFAIAIFDRVAGRTILARDRIGIKPLYYFRNSTTTYFSSEAKSFLALDRSVFSRDLNYQLIELLLGFMFLPDRERTSFDKVRKVVPGHYLQVNKRGEIIDSTYYDLTEAKDTYRGGFDGAVAELDALLSEAVKSHLMSDVPLGVLLSGGLDSSLITALVKKQTDSRVLTFTAKFNHRFNESDKALTVARYLGTDHSEIIINPAEVNRDIENIASELDDLSTLDPGLLTTKILCREVKKKGVTVLLLGEGADEIFGGYSWFGLSQLPFSAMPSIVRSALYYYAVSRNITFNPLKYYPFWNQQYRNFRNHDIFRNTSNIELLLQLPNHLLMKVDKGSMAASVEARVPYLDHKVIEFVYSLPREFKLKSRVYSPTSLNEKYILREVAKRYLPEGLVNRKKRGFMLPMKEVLESNFDKVKSYALAENSITSRFIPRKKIESLFKPSAIPPLAMEREYLLWRIFLLEVWYRWAR